VWGCYGGKGGGGGVGDERESEWEMRGRVSGR